MIELNRSLYLIKDTKDKNESFSILKENLKELEEQLISFLNTEVLFELFTKA